MKPDCVKLFLALLAVLAAPLMANGHSRASAADSKTAGESDANTGDTYKLYFLGGQSNMAGFGASSKLSGDLKAVQQRVYIFHGNAGADNASEDGRGVWAPLRPGHGAGFTSNTSKNNYSARFGPELTFGRRMAELDKDSHIAIIKYVKGATALQIGAAPGGTWDPDSNFGNGVNQYDHFLAAVRNALATNDINGDGAPDEIIPAGIVWMQGEGDAAHTVHTARHYQPKLKRLIDLIRAAFRTDDLPVVIGQISDSGQDKDGKIMDYAGIVRDAQADFVATDVNAALVKTDGYAFISDGWHFTTESYLDLGAKFAEAVYALQDGSR